jgi:hypothetical protein
MFGSSWCSMYSKLGRRNTTKKLAYLAGWQSNREANVDSCRLAFSSLYPLITAELLEYLVCYHTS